MAFLVLKGTVPTFKNEETPMDMYCDQNKNRETVHDHHPSKVTSRIQSYSHLDIYNMDRDLTRQVSGDVEVFG